MTAVHERKPTSGGEYKSLVRLYVEFMIVSFMMGALIMWNAPLPEEEGQIFRESLKRSKQIVTNNKKENPDGFMVLGMHRSGTSMLTGALHRAAGYTYGESIRAVVTNPRGTYEYLPIVLQNDLWMEHQGTFWDGNVLGFDWETALMAKESGTVDFSNGTKALRELLEKPNNLPWLQKDPRMIITLNVWRMLLRKDPAIVFTYRNPLDVAMSLESRYKRQLKFKVPPQHLQKMTLTRGLKLWIAYNQLAIQNSRGLCMVRTNHASIMADPVSELQRISDKLTSLCGLSAPFSKISKTEVDAFVDNSLRHHKTSDAAATASVLQSHNNGTCLAYSYKSSNIEGTLEYNLELETYLAAMKVFCDLESGIAYEENYPWPEVTLKDELVFE